MICIKYDRFLCVLQVWPWNLLMWHGSLESCSCNHTLPIDVQFEKYKAIDWSTYICLVVCLYLEDDSLFSCHVRNPFQLILMSPLRSSFARDRKTHVVIIRMLCSISIEVGTRKQQIQKCILLQNQKCHGLCLTAISSAVYGPMVAKVTSDSFYVSMIPQDYQFTPVRVRFDTPLAVR